MNVTKLAFTMLDLAPTDYRDPWFLVKMPQLSWNSMDIPTIYIDRHLWLRERQRSTYMSCRRSLLLILELCQEFLFLCGRYFLASFGLWGLIWPCTEVTGCIHSYPGDRARRENRREARTHHPAGELEEIEGRHRYAVPWKISRSDACPQLRWTEYISLPGFWLAPCRSREDQPNLTRHYFP